MRKIYAVVFGLLGLMGCSDDDNDNGNSSIAGT